MHILNKSVCATFIVIFIYIHVHTNINAYEMNGHNNKSAHILCWRRFLLVFFFMDIQFADIPGTLGNSI